MNHMTLTLSIDNRQKKINPAAVSVQALVRQFESGGGKVLLVSGENDIFDLSLMMAARAMTRGEQVAVIDGCNKFNVHALVGFARRNGINPDAFLRRIFVSRGFTCYQMEAAIDNRLPAFLKRAGSRTAMILGLLDTMYDEQAPMREVRQIFAHVLKSLAAMKAEGISILLSCRERKVAPEERNQLLGKLKRSADCAYMLTTENEERRLFVQYGNAGALKNGTTKAVR